MALPWRLFRIIVSLAIPVMPVCVFGQTGSVRIEVRLESRFHVRTWIGTDRADDVGPEPRRGRLIVVAVPAPASGRDRSGTEPRFSIGRVGAAATPIAAIDVSPAFFGGAAAVVDDRAVAFPMPSLAELPSATYDIQAVLIVNQDLYLTNAPGNYHSRPARVEVAPARNPVVRLELTERIPDERWPAVETEYVRFVRMRSELLSAFHGRPIYLRAAVILPRGFDDDVRRRYPVRLTVGGYGARYYAMAGHMRQGNRQRALWLADDSPRMLRILLDGAGPYGDPYQINSANNGPYGDAVTEELIPFIEARFRGVGAPSARVVDGSSTGGWVALALQLFYPDFFNGAWAFCPDAVDFRALQRVNIYADENAYVDQSGQEQPSRRGGDGLARFSMRHEVAMETVLGLGDLWSRSGRQWGAWNAAYGPRGEDGSPVPLWDPDTGVINRTAALHWRGYDLRRILERDWNLLRDKLDGKLWIAVGEMDDYFLERAVHLFENFVSARDPTFSMHVAYGAGRGHCWNDVGERDLLRQMGNRMGATP